jgi:hypothetical protein
MTCKRNTWCSFCFCVFTFVGKKFSVIVIAYMYLIDRLEKKLICEAIVGSTSASNRWSLLIKISK